MCNLEWVNLFVHNSRIKILDYASLESDNKMGRVEVSISLDVISLNVLSLRFVSIWFGLALINPLRGTGISLDIGHALWFQVFWMAFPTTPRHLESGNSIRFSSLDSFNKSCYSSSEMKTSRLFLLYRDFVGPFLLWGESEVESDKERWGTVHG